MAEQILSQEEIDSLLSAMKEGQVDLPKDEKTEQEVEDYDLTSQSVTLQEEFYALEEVYHRFVDSFQKSLSTSLRKEIEVEYSSKEIVRFGETLKGFYDPMSLNIFSMEPLEGSALLAIEANLVFSLVDCMFGGEGKPLNEMREFTMIEQRLMRRFVLDLLKELEEAWSLVYPVKLSLEKTDTKPQFLRLFPSSDLVLSVVFSLSGAEFSGNIILCISCLMLEPIKDRLSSSHLKGKGLQTGLNPQVKKAIQDAPLTMSVELGKAQYTIRDLMNLQEEDVLMLDKGPEDNVTVKVGGARKFMGSPGVIKGSRAVQITDIVERGKE